MTNPIPNATQERILSAAEKLFAKRGYSGVSLRQITTVAEVNLAAVNYHYYDKEGLFREILRRSLGQINEERLELLAAAQFRAGATAVPLGEIFSALARPVFLPQRCDRAFAPQLLGRLLSDRQPFADSIVREEFQPAMTRFGQALRRHQPALPPKDFVWRVSFIVGALHHALVTLPDMPLHTDGLCRADDCAGALENFIAFATKAFSA